jgi:hypothetical protein
MAIVHRRVQPAKFVPILKEMRELILKYEFLEHADHVSRLIDSANLDSPDLVDQLLRGGVWSAAGSLADLQFTGNVQGVPEEQLYRDDMEYQRLLVRLADEMKAQGIRDKSVEDLAEWMRKFVEQFDTS